MNSRKSNLYLIAKNNVRSAQRHWLDYHVTGKVAYKEAAKEEGKRAAVFWKAAFDN